MKIMLNFSENSVHNQLHIIKRFLWPIRGVVYGTRYMFICGYFRRQWEGAELKGRRQLHRDFVVKVIDWAVMRMKLISCQKFQPHFGRTIKIDFWLDNYSFERTSPGILLQCMKYKIMNYVVYIITIIIDYFWHVKLI